MIVFGRIFSHILLKSRARGYVYLAAYYGLYAVGLAFLIKGYRPVHNSVVGYRYGTVTALGNAGRNVLYTTRPVEQAIFAMQMQMYKIRHSFTS
jgi:hypothetical protein